MSFKKQLCVSVSLAACFITTLALAGGSVDASPSFLSKSPVFSGIYLEANAGYSNRDWQNFTNPIFSTTNTQSASGNRGTFASGLDLGYQINERAALEMGWLDIAGVDGVSTSGDSYHNSTTLTYAALKVYFHLYSSKAYLFFKAGGAYLQDRVAGADRSGATNAQRNAGDLVAAPGTTAYSYHGEALFGAGAYYAVTSHWSVNLQFMYLPGYYHSDSNDYTTPPISLYLFGIGYKFLV